MTKKDKLRAKLDKRSKKNDTLRVQKSTVAGQIGDRVAESGGVDPCPFLNDPIGVLMEEKKVMPLPSNT